MTDRGYELSAQFYDLFDRKPNINFYYFYASQAGESLDIGAGTGRIAVPLAELGCRLVCIEPSEAMRTQMEQKLDQQPALRERISIVPSDAASFKLNKTFPLAMMSSSFRHFLTDEERLNALKNVSAHLKPGGMLVFDVSQRMIRQAPSASDELDDTPPSPAGEVQIEGGVIRRSLKTRILPEGLLQVTFVFETFHGEQMVERIVQGSVQGIITRERIAELLKEAGLTVVNEYADYDFRPFQEGEDILMIEARKPR